MDATVIGVCILSALAGSGMGLFSGLVPGIHVNTLASVMMAAYPALLGSMSGIVDADYVPLAVCSCIMSASVVHSFVDFVPSVFIGAPDSEDAVSVLPGHRLLLKGEGMAAVRAAAIGSLVGSVATVLLSIPLQWLLLHGLDGILSGLTPVVLVAASAAILSDSFRRGNGAWGLMAFAVSGMLGLECMTLPIQMSGILGDGSIMLPMLTGLFGLPVLMSSSSSGRVPVQRDRVGDPVGPWPGLKGVLMGTLAGWFPGITSTVGASMSAAVFPERDPARFISVVASVGTVTSILSLVVLSVSGDGRSGTALVIGEIAGSSLRGFASEWFLVLLLCTAIASVAGYSLTIASGKLMGSLICRIRPDVLGRSVMVLLVVIVLVLTGPVGIIILVCSTVVGHIPEYCGTGRIVLCGCLILPVLLFKLGLA